MRHTRGEVIRRANREFKLMDKLLAGLTTEQWHRRLARPETKDPWTIKDAVAHTTHWKADIIRSISGQPRPAEMHGLTETQENHVVYARWHRRTPKEVLAWHRQVHKDVLSALRAAPDEWFTGRNRRAEWPNDLDGHSSYHRVKDIERALSDDKA